MSCAPKSPGKSEARTQPQGLQVVVLSGGEPIRHQVSALKGGVHIAVGTPGRLLDHLNRGSVETRAIKTVVLDEADRMLDMGFQPDMEKILAALPRSRQTVFFSATFPESIEAMSRSISEMPSSHDPRPRASDARDSPAHCRG